MDTSAAGQKQKHPPKQNTAKYSLFETVSKLRDDDARRVFNALVLIRKVFLKQKDGIDRLLKYGGVEALLQIISKSNEKQKNLALSILGNICLDTRVQRKVCDKEGITILCGVVKECKDKEIINRACRSLANLAQNPECCIAIKEQEDVIIHIIDHLDNTEDKELRFTIIRTLRIFGKTPSLCRIILDEDGVKSVTKLLKVEDDDIIKAVLNCMRILTKKFSVDCARQIIASDAPTSVIQLTQHTDKEISRTAFSLLVTDWINHEEMRVGIGNAGGVPFYAENLEKFEEKRKRLLMANALCLCCCEVVNRARIKENNILEKMLKLLQDSDFELIHDRLIAALTGFLYDQSGFEILLKNDIVDILLVHLRRVCHINEEPTPCEVYEESTKNIALSENTKGDTNLLPKDQEIKEKSVLREHGSSLDNAEVESAAKEVETTKQDIEKENIIKDSGSSLDDGVKEYNPNEIKSKDSLSNESDKTKDKDQQYMENMECESAAEAVPSNSVLDDQATPGTSTFNEDEEQSKSDIKPVPKYSLDSPTYKSVVENQAGENYDNYEGPKNILESQFYLEQTSWPHSPHSPYPSPVSNPSFSPLSTSSYESGDFSPSSSPNPKMRAWSPVLSTSDVATSPESLGQYSDDEMQISPTPSTSDISESKAMLLKPSIKEEDQYSESLYFSSSSEEDVSDDDWEDSVAQNKINLGSEPLPITLPSTPSSSSLSPDSAMRVKPFFKIGSDTSDTDTSTDGRKSLSHRRAPLPDKTGQKRKKNITPQMRKKILLSVEKSSTTKNSIDLPKILTTKLMAPSIENDNTSEKECIVGKKDMKRHTEYCLILLLNRISYGSDPQYLVKHHVISTLLDYTRCVEQPFAKCRRMLIRLTKNPDCFESIMMEIIPAFVHEKLFIKKNFEDEPLEQSKSVIPSCHISPETPKEETKQIPEAFHRSMSTCALKEEHQAKKFHKKVFEQVEPGSSQLKPENVQESIDLKMTLFSTIAIMAESPFGQGVIEHILLTGTKKEKVHLVVSLAYICRSKSMLEKTFFEMDGITHLFDAIEQTHCPQIQKNALNGIFTLALNYLKQTTQKLKVTNSNKTVEEPHDVFFKLSNGTKISAHRTTMVQRSEVFAAMLEGHYSESTQSEINIPDVKSDAFQILVDHIHGKKECSKHSDQLSTLLEAHGLAHRFLVPEMQKTVAVRIAEEHMTESNIEDIFNHALLHESSWLINECMQFVLRKGYQYHDLFRSIVLNLTAKKFKDIFSRH